MILDYKVFDYLDNKSNIFLVKKQYNQSLVKFI